MYINFRQKALFLISIFVIIINLTFEIDDNNFIIVKQRVNQLDNDDDKHILGNMNYLFLLFFLKLRVGLEW